MTLSVPVLETERLIMREPRLSDFDHIATYYASDRSRFTGGPKNRYEAFQTFSGNCGQWALLGTGMWMVERKDTGDMIGQIGLWNPDGWIAPEIGWWITDPRAEGKGFAYEAAIRARRYAFEDAGWPEAFSVIAEGNDRSVALAERMGATLDRKEPWKEQFTILIYRHPTPEVSA